jgi:DNA-binding NarL/FixJ family response regulator
LEQLPLRQREVLERMNAGESSEQIGKAMNITPTSVRSLKRFALSAIKLKVQQFEDGNKES